MKNGFTLIELLATIIILAIISLIAYPVMTGLIEDNKKRGAVQSAVGYIKVIDDQMVYGDISDSKKITPGLYDVPMDSIYGVTFKGEAPSSGWVEVVDDKVNRYSLVIRGYVISYDGETKTVVKGTEAVEKPEIALPPEDFSTDSWATIIEAVRNNDTSVYHVGDTKEVDMGEFGKHNVRIANMSTPSECSTDGFSQTACGFVLEFSDVITEHNINSTDTNVGGWPATSMREYVNSDIFDSLPRTLKPGIIDTSIVSGHGSSDNTNFTSTDKLYLLSAKEVWGIENRDTADAETRQLDYYKESGVTRSNYSGTIKNLNESPNWWWLRTPNDVITDYFYGVNTDGAHNTHCSAVCIRGVSPAFRIG